MGKVRKQKQKAPRVDPVGLDSAIAELQHGMDQEEFANGKESGAVETMMAQLQSVNIEDKVCGCHALARHASNPQFVKSALEAQVARCCAPFLLENDPVLRLAAVGALKNLSSHHPDTAEGLVGQDMMTPLSVFLTSLPNNWRPNCSNKEDPLTPTLVQALDLLWNLVEASPTALQMFNERGLVEVVSRLASPNLHHPALLQAALSCLASATESNPPANQALQGQVQDFLQLCSNGPSLLARATASILVIHLHGNAIFSSPSFAAILEVSSLALSSDPCSTLASVAKIGGEGEDDDGGMEVVENKVEDRREEAGVKVAQDILAAQHTALELLVNLTGLGDEEDGDDWDDDDVEDDFEDEEEMEGHKERKVEANPVLVEAIVSKGLPQRVAALASDLPDETRLFLIKRRGGKDLISQHTALRTRALLCLSNLIEVLSIEEQGGATNLHSTWTHLGTLCLPAATDFGEELQEAATAALRAATSKMCAEPEGRKLFHLNASDLKQILDLYTSLGVASTRANIVQVVGEIAGVAALAVGDTTSQEVLAGLANWLLETGAKDQALVVAGEALDKFIDVFSEDDQDALFARLGLLQKTKHALNAFKIRLDQEKGQLGSALSLLKQVRTNLQRFVKYKQKRPLIAGKS